MHTVRLPNGAEYDLHCWIRRASALASLASTLPAASCLSASNRTGEHRDLADPGGLADADEDLQSAGLRQLREETGYVPVEVTADTVSYLGAVWDNPAMGTAMSRIYRVRGLAPTGDSHTDEGEFVTLHWVEPAWIKEAVRNRTIQDRVVVAAVAYLLLNGEL